MSSSSSSLLSMMIPSASMWWCELVVDDDGSLSTSSEISSRPKFWISSSFKARGAGGNFWYPLWLTVPIHERHKSNPWIASYTGGHKRNLAKTYPGYLTFTSVTIFFAPWDRVFRSKGTTNFTTFCCTASGRLAHFCRHWRKRSSSFVATQLSKYHIGSSSSSICNRSHSLLLLAAAKNSRVVVVVKCWWGVAVAGTPNLSW